MSSSPAYSWTSLTAAVADKGSPLREYLGARFPNRAPLQAAYRASAGAIHVPGGDANAGTLGAAFDFLVRTVLDSTASPTVALAAFREPAHVAAIGQVIETAGRFSDCRSSAAPEPLLRAVWALALCTEVFRAGLMPGSPLQEALRRGEFTTAGLLQLAPPNALEQLQQLHQVAVLELYPKLPDVGLGYSMGPTFDASGLCAADADFIVGGLLVEVKVRLGALNTKGQRSDALSLEDIYQMLSYVLFDRSNQYGIDRIALYSARYGQFTTWSLSDYMGELSGQTLDLAAERATIWELLGGRPGPLPAHEGGSAAAAPTAADDYYVDVLESAEAWYELVEQVDEPTTAEWDSAHDTLGDAVGALREFEATAGTGARDESWGGTRAQVVAVVDAADAWCTAHEADEFDEAAADAVFDRLGDAVQALRVVERRS
jgi:hypothetical protein